jgi:hypothetical protein
MATLAFDTTDTRTTLLDGSTELEAADLIELDGVNYHPRNPGHTEPEYPESWDDVTAETEVDFDSLQPPPQHVVDAWAEGTGPVVLDEDVGDWGKAEVNAHCAALVKEEVATLKAHDIDATEAETWFADGQKLADVGHDNLKRDDAAYRAMPETEVSLARFKATIEREGRRDVMRNLTEYRIDVNGNLSRTADAAKGEGYSLEHVAWRQLQAIARGPNVNAGLASTKLPADRRIRTRECREGDRSIFAIVSPDQRKGYTVCDGNQVADLVQAGLSQAGMLRGSKAEVTYEQASTRYKIRTILQAPIDIPAFRGVGRVHQVFLDVQGGDDGNASVKGQLGIVRLRCMNASKSEATGTTFDRVHRGDVNHIRNLVRQLCGKFGAVAKSMSDLWTKASANYYLDPEGGRLSPEEAIKRLVLNGMVPTGERTPAEAIERYTSAWKAEEGVYSAAGIVMAIQRAAHEADWKSSWATDEIEDAASHMLYQPVYTLKDARA